MTDRPREHAEPAVARPGAFGERLGGIFGLRDVPAFVSRDAPAPDGATPPRPA